MLVVISPAKTLDFESSPRTKKSSKPQFLDQSQQLIDQLRKLSPNELSELMGISDKLAALNTARYETWSPPFTLKNAKQAYLAFKGDVYAGLEAEHFDAEDDKFAQQHLRILSGLYGVLRPLDLIQPYRLEMGTRLNNSEGKDLYHFWQQTLVGALNKELKKSGSSAIINLASNEYFKAIKSPQLNAEIITPVFKDMKNGNYKVISFFAKKARGMMARHIIKKRITEAKGLKRFRGDGYRYNASLSSAREWVFTRDQS